MVTWGSKEEICIFLIETHVSDIWTIQTCGADVFEWFQIPIWHCFVCWSTSKSQSLWVELKAWRLMFTSKLMLGELEHCSTWGDFPNLELAVNTTWCYPLSIWRDRNISYGISMLLICKNGLTIAGSQIPYLYVWINRSWCYHIALLFIGDAGNSRLMALQDSWFLTR